VGGRTYEFPCQILPLFGHSLGSASAGWARPPLSKKSIDFDHEIIKMVEKAATPAILSRTLH
jgi:hypothetical protein